MYAHINQGTYLRIALIFIALFAYPRIFPGTDAFKRRTAFHLLLYATKNIISTTPKVFGPIPPRMPYNQTHEVPRA